MLIISFVISLTSTRIQEANLDSRFLKKQPKGMELKQKAKGYPRGSFSFTESFECWTVVTASIGKLLEMNLKLSTDITAVTGHIAAASHPQTHWSTYD